MDMVREVTQKTGGLQLNEATSEATDNKTPEFAPCKMCIALHTKCSPNCASKRWEQKKLWKQSRRDHADDGKKVEGALMTPEKVPRPSLQHVGEEKQFLQEPQSDHKSDDEKTKVASMSGELVPRLVQDPAAEARLLQQKWSGHSADSNNAKVALASGGLPPRPAREPPKSPLVTGGLPPRPVREAPRLAQDLAKEKQLSRETQSNHAGDVDKTKAALMTGELPSSLVQDQDADDCNWAGGLAASRIEDCVLVFYDFETTGLNWRSEGITEMAAQRIHYKDGHWVRDGEALQFFVNPGKPVPAFITKLTGITTAMVRNAVSLEEGLEKLQAYIADSAPRPTIPMAHNGKAFDRQFPRYRWPKSIRGDFDPPNVEYWGDSISLFKLLSPGRFEKYKLGMLYESLNGPKSNAHRALDDVRMMEFCIDSLWSSRVGTFDSRLDTLHRLASTKKGAPPEAKLQNSTIFRLDED